MQRVSTMLMESDLVKLTSANFIAKFI